jgi:threonine dehydrogenase-like Zn-dependent dehydrogenase
LVVTDIDQARLDRAAEILTKAEAAKHGIDLVYLNTGNVEDPVKQLMELSGNEGYDDVLVFAPVASVIEQGDSILGQDGCLNFFAGPSDPNFRAKFNFYNVHYASTHIVGTSGGNTDDMREVLDMISEEKLNPSILITHIGGLDAVIETTKNLPNLPGSKKLIYTHISLPLTAISDFEEKGKTDTLFAGLAEIVAANNGMWSPEAEKYLLENAKPI